MCIVVTIAVIGDNVCLGLSTILEVCVPSTLINIGGSLRQESMYPLVKDSGLQPSTLGSGQI